MHRSISTALALAGVTAISVSLASLGAGPGAPAPVTIRPAAPPQLKKIELDLDKAIAIPIPKPKTMLRATIFKTPDQKEGWAIQIPGNRPLATPTYYQGRIYVGGGYGSHEFYCFDALTGALVWKYNTSDDGPTAAVVENGMVAFNTESCTVFVLDAATGKLVWQEWLGDPLMSQPATSEGKLFIAYPGGHAKHAKAPLNGATSRPHRMLCADLKTGKHLWEYSITGDVISAPVVDNEKLLFTCNDGTSFCLSTETGQKVWEKANAGTSAPVVAKGQVVTTEKETRGGDTFEGIQIVDSKTGKGFLKQRALASAAPYFQGATNGTIAPHAQTMLDASVGFGGGAPAAAQMNKAKEHLNINSVAGAWAYQGPRVAVKGMKAFKAQGTTIQSFELASLPPPPAAALSTQAKTSAAAVYGDEGHNPYSNPYSSQPVSSWQASVKGRSIDHQSQVFSPPALGKENMYLVSQAGHLVSLNQTTGSISFAYSTGQPVAMQPALAGGNVYIGTSNGMLICLKTGARDADGWTAWGGNSQHNKQD